MVGITISLSPDHNKTDINPKLLEQLGRITVQWARIEFLLFVEIQNLLARPEIRNQVEIHEPQISTERRIRQWKTLNKIFFKDSTSESEAIDRFVSHLLGDMHYRHDLIHSFWDGRGGPTEIKFGIVNVRKGKSTWQRLTITETTLDEFLEKLMKRYTFLINVQLALLTTKVGD